MEFVGIVPRRRRQQGGVSWRQRGGRRTPRSGWTISRPGRKPWAAVQPRDGLRQCETLNSLHEVQNVATASAAETPEPLRVFVDREGSLRLIVEGADALADATPTAQPDARRLHDLAEGVALLERRDIHRGACGGHREPPFARGRSPRRLCRETSFPTGQRIPRMARTSSAPPGCGASTAARPVPGL